MHPTSERRGTDWSAGLKQEDIEPIRLASMNIKTQHWRYYPHGQPKSAVISMLGVGNSMNNQYQANQKAMVMENGFQGQQVQLSGTLVATATQHILCSSSRRPIEIHDRLLNHTAIVNVKTP